MIFFWILKTIFFEIDYTLVWSVRKRESSDRGTPLPKHKLYEGCPRGSEQLPRFYTQYQRMLGRNIAGEHYHR